MKDKLIKLGLVITISVATTLVVLGIRDNSGLIQNSGPLGASGFFAQNASVQGNLAFFGEIKPDGSSCANGEILKKTGSDNWDCAADGGGGGGTQIELKDVPGTYNTNVSSVSFDGGKFTITASGSAGLVNLDWGSAGPASLSEAETITANWVNTDNPWADNEVADTISIIGGIIGANSISGTQTTTGTLTIGDNGDSIIIDASNWDISTLGKADFLSASVSTNFEAVGYASASLFRGLAFGATEIDCNDATDKLLWSAGLFTCGTLSVADTSATGGTGIDISTNDFVFDATELEALTWGAGGNATNVWTHNLSAGDPTITWTGSGATLSLNFEVIGYASASQYFTLDLAATALTRNQFGIDEGGFGQFVFRASGSEQVLSGETTHSISVASNSFNTFASRSLGYLYRGKTIKRMSCKVSTATSVVINFSANGTTDMDQITCATTQTHDDGTIANSTMTKGADWVLERKTVTGEADFLTITWTEVQTRE